MDAVCRAAAVSALRHKHSTSGARYDTDCRQRGTANGTSRDKLETVHGDLPEVQALIGHEGHDDPERYAPHTSNSVDVSKIDLMELRLIILEK